MSVARLVRVGGRYFMQMASGKSKRVSRDLRNSLTFGTTWPAVSINFKGAGKDLVAFTGSNHYCTTVGDFDYEIETFSRQAGISIVRMDDTDSLMRFKEEIASQ